MAYPYIPAYQVYPGYLPQGYQTMAQPQQLQAQAPTVQNSIIWVSGLMEAQSYPVAPNNAVALWEQSGKVIYLKSADATGKPTMRVYDLVERTETTSAAPPATDVKMPDYATKDELSAITVAIKAAMNDIEQMKSDLYGMAGRKKTAKKPEAEDDE